MKNEEPFRQLESLASLTNCWNGTKLLNWPLPLLQKPVSASLDAGEGDTTASFDPFVVFVATRARGCWTCRPRYPLLICCRCPVTWRWCPGLGMKKNLILRTRYHMGDASFAYDDTRPDHAISQAICTWPPIQMIWWVVTLKPLEIELPKQNWIIGWWWIVSADWYTVYTPLFLKIISQYLLDFNATLSVDDHFGRRP
jgi:hypothetical protein